MIEFDYLIRRDEGDEMVDYKPKDIPTRINNLSYIEGPNSSGKSTLLHIIALGMHGLEITKLTPALKHKLEDLLDSTYQDLTFNIKIHNDCGDLEIESNKEDGKTQTISVYQTKNGKRKLIAPDRLAKEYNLIYDIPNDPTARLTQLTSAIQEIQLRKAKQLKDLRYQIKLIIEELKRSRDPEQIAKLNKEIVKMKDAHETAKEDHEWEKDVLECIEKYTYSRCFLKNLYKLEAIEKSIESLKKESNKKIRKANKLDKETKEKREHAHARMEAVKRKHLDITQTLRAVIPKKHSNLLTVWDKIDFDETLRSRFFKESYKTVLLNLKNILFELLDNKENSEEVEAAKIFQSLIDILEEHESKDIRIPGIDQSISDFVTSLKKESEKKRRLLDITNNIEKLINDLDHLDEEIKIFETELFPKLARFDSEEEFSWLENEDQISKEVDRLEDEKMSIVGLCEYYNKECAKKDISDNQLDDVISELSQKEEMEIYTTYTEDQLQEKILSLKRSIKDDSENLNKKERSIRSMETEIARLEKQEHHIYEGRQEDLSKIEQLCAKLQQRFETKYDTYINDIIHKKQSQDKDEERNRYQELVSKYLAKRVGYIQHGQEEFEVQRIDMLKGIIYTSAGKRIKLISMGTGQSQSAYLMGQLNASDDRKIIALFDEVAMMDKKALKPLFRKMKELHDDGKLLAGIVVQVGEKIRVVEL